MNRPHDYAVEAAKEITIAAMQHSGDRTPWLNGDNVASFFETVYNKIYEIAKEQKN